MANIKTLDGNSSTSKADSPEAEGCSIWPKFEPLHMLPLTHIDAQINIISPTDSSTLMFLKVLLTGGDSLVYTVPSRVVPLLRPNQIFSSCYKWVSAASLVFPAFPSRTARRPDGQASEKIRWQWQDEPVRMRFQIRPLKSRNGMDTGNRGRRAEID